MCIKVKIAQSYKCSSELHGWFGERTQQLGNGTAWSTVLSIELVCLISLFSVPSIDCTSFYGKDGFTIVRVISTGDFFHLIGSQRLTAMAKVG